MAIQKITSGVIETSQTLTTPTISGNLNIDSTGTTGIRVPSANTLVAYNGGVERVRVDSSGNLGLGYTPSAWYGYKAIQYSNGTNAHGSLAIGSYTSQSIMDLSTNYYNDATTGDTYIGAGYSAKYRQYAGKHIFYVAPSGSAGGAISYNTMMQIDNNGYVTMPSQPAFHAIDTGTNSLVSGAQNIILGATRVNRGSIYNTSNGRFTAPVSGTYYLYAQIILESGGGQAAWFKINGSDPSTSNSNLYSSISSGYTTTSSHIMITLSAGDYVNWYMSSGNTNLGNCVFGGWLIG
jgi:hypothetical protein